MRAPLTKVLLWSPRILGILFALFLSLFALDVFGEGYGFWGTAVALFIHLLPTFVLLIALALGWRWPWVGALGFLGFVLWYLGEAWGGGVAAVIVWPPLLIGLLFLLNWSYRPELRPGH